jgi:uncharacterized protein (TIGR00369 family)
MLSIAELERMIDEIFPEIHYGARTLTIEALTDRGCRVRLAAHAKNLRPGGTVSGPAMFTLADYGIYVAILARFGVEDAQAVTTNMTMNFMSRPEPGDILGEMALLKVGKRQIVADAHLRSASGMLVAHAIATYARPQRSG